MRHQVGLAILALAAALPVSAEQVNVTVTGWAYGDWNTAQTAVIQKTSAPVFSPSTEYAGGFSASINGQGSFTTFCTDIYESFGFSSTPYSYDRLNVADTQTLWANSPYNPDSYTLVSKLYTAHFGQVTDVKTSTAFQLALWELLYESDGSYSVSSGKFTATQGSSVGSGAQGLANDWLNSLGDTAGYDIRSLHSVGSVGSAGRQDFLVATPVPEPEAYALALVSLGIVAGYTRRKRAKS